MDTSQHKGAQGLRGQGDSHKNVFCPIKSLSLSFVFARTACACLLIAALLPFQSLAQRRRPQLLPATKDFYAGKVVLIPRDAQLQQVRMLAQVGDQNLVLPPSRLLEPKPQAEQLIEWAMELNLAETNGLIISIETIVAEASAETLPPRLQALRKLRAQQPKLPVYGFVSLDASEASKQNCQIAIDLAADGTLSYLLIGQAESLSAKPAQITRARLIGEIASRQIEDRVAFDDSPNVAAATLLARLIVHQYGQTPKILPVYSSKEGRQSTETRDTIPLDQSIAAKIRLSGGALPVQDSEATPGVDLLLFVLTPQTSEEQRAGFAKAVAQTIEKGARVAVVDLSGSKASKEALMAELRNQKLLDKLAAYASSTLAEESPASQTREAVNRALAQAVIHFAAMKSLRNDLDRVQRIDRAQVTLLFSRYLQDWAYNLMVRPKLDNYLRELIKADPGKLGENAERAEKYAFDLLHPMAETLFDEQFRRNTHAILLNSGQRAQFRISLLQRLQIQFATQKTSDAEVKQSIHTFYEGTVQITK